MEIDWKRIHDRLEKTGTSIAGGSSYTPDETKNILRARARKLAREPEDRKQAEESCEILEFKLAYENYGMDLAFIQEVQPLRLLTPLPGVRPFIIGVINVRGKVFSVIDLKRFFELPDKGLTDLNKVIIVRQGSMEFGILADAVIGVRSINPDEIQPSLPTLTDIRLKYLKGVTSEHLVLLDAAKLLDDKSLVMNGV